nr:immunoglobulin heavy chain junction region [Macaca mulatta]MOW86720.1 immunoglobulin heavy chain junction region [Macaca mulatta]MOW86763.1 immunoglobulin heavy chain junction region [Macaca mulatta]MOW87641.1 immunoglobulin heavy chain junction region [Macaca mulatta]MOW87893.1 immunoglobulin heavy chain junction region [Macaca mulatta]
CTRARDPFYYGSGYDTVKGGLGFW